MLSFGCHYSATYRFHSVWAFPFFLYSGTTFCGITVKATCACSQLLSCFQNERADERFKHRPKSCVHALMLGCHATESCPPRLVFICSFLFSLSLISTLFFLTFHLSHFFHYYCFSLLLFEVTSLLQAFYFFIILWPITFSTRHHSYRRRKKTLLIK